MDICVLSLARGSELCLSAYYEKNFWNFFFNLAGVHVLGWPLFGWGRGDFSFTVFFLGGLSVGQIIYREHTVFGGSNISCSLVTAELVDFPEDT